MGPLDYTMDVLSPFQMAIGGYGAAMDQAVTRQNMGLAQNQDARAQEQLVLAQRAQSFQEQQQRAELAMRQQALAQQQAQFDAQQAAIAAQEARQAAAIESASALVDMGAAVTGRDIMRFMVQFPELAAPAQQIWDMTNAERRETELEWAGQSIAASLAGEDELRRVIEDRLVAAENDNSDPALADTLRLQLQQLDMPNGIDLVRLPMAMTILQVLGPEAGMAYLERAGMQMGAEPDQTDRVQNYQFLIEQGVDPQEAIDRAFGELSADQRAQVLTGAEVMTMFPGSQVQDPTALYTIGEDGAPALVSGSGQAEQFRPATPEEVAAASMGQMGPDGRFIPPPSGQTMTIYDPRTGAPIMTQGSGSTGLPAIPERQSQIQLFGSMMDMTAPVINAFEEQYDPANVTDAIARNTPLIGNFFQSETGQQYQAAAAAWSEGALRLATGAAATQPEIERVQRTYFAQPGDTPATLALKRRLRAAYEQSLTAASAGAFQPGNANMPPDPLTFAEELAPEVVAPTGQAAPDGQVQRLRYNPETGEFE